MDDISRNPLKFTEEEQETFEGFADAIDNAMAMSDEDFEEFKKKLAEQFPIGADEMLKGLDEARAEILKESSEKE